MAASFYAQLDRITELLRTRGRVSYRALKRELGLDDALLADLAAELDLGAAPRRREPRAACSNGRGRQQSRVAPSGVR